MFFIKDLFLEDELPYFLRLVSLKDMYIVYDEYLFL